MVKKVLFSTLKNTLYIKKRKLYKLPRQIFQNIFWENNVDNLYYGHYQILKKYSGAIIPYKINGEMQHGWTRRSGITSLDLGVKSNNLSLKRYYVFNSNNKKKALNGGYKNVVAIGAPFLYIKNPKQYYSQKISNSLITFPSHTHEFGGFKNTFETYKTYLQSLKKIEKKFSLVVVSLGWEEYKNSNIVALFENEGISVVCMGHRDKNPNFLIKFINEVSKFEYVSSDNVSSAVFYSLFMKKKVFLYGELMKENNIWHVDNLKRELTYDNRMYPQLFWDSFDYKSHSYLADKELGVDHKKTPEELREIFKWNIENLFFSKRKR